MHSTGWRYPISQVEPEYAAWSRLNAREEIGKPSPALRVASLSVRPLISVILPVHDPEPLHLERALASVEAQSYPHWELCIADDASRNPSVVRRLSHEASKNAKVKLTRLEHSRHIAGATNAAIATASGELVAFLDHDDELTVDALLEVARVAAADPSADVIYSDHDVLGEDAMLRSPCFKPDWSPELLLSYMYLGHLKVYRTALVRELGGLRDGYPGSADYELALRIVEKARNIHHIPQILYHWRAAPGSLAATSEAKPESFEAGRKAVAHTLERRGIVADAQQPAFAQRARIGVYKLRFRRTGDIPVTIIIPTKDKLDLLRGCIDSIEQRSTHRNYRILIVDNDSSEGATIEYLSRTRHKVLHVSTAGVFNFAALINAGVAAINTEYFVLLNNDTLVIAPEWLEEMLGYGIMPGVGAVGAKLLYADGSIQHAGVILGIHGLTGHAFQPLIDTPDATEYLYYAHVARNYLAVTAACMLSNRSAFRSVAGFDELNLKVAWNDVDYCLRLREKGLRTVFNPYALLYHLESQSRGDDKNPAEIRYMLQHWRPYIERDPYLNPNLSRLDQACKFKTDSDEHLHFYYRKYLQP